jgi:hypothetical protein
MNAYELPTSLTIGGVGFSIRSDFRAILDILRAWGDPELDDDSKALVMLQIFYPDWEKIPQEHLEEAFRLACEFIDCGQEPDENRRDPRLMDWDQDAQVIIPAVNRVAHTEIRALPYLHWWTFFGYFMEIGGECLFSSILDIRRKKAKGKKLEKYEQEFYRTNKSAIDLKVRLSEEDQAKKDGILKWL